MNMPYIFKFTLVLILPVILFGIGVRLLKEKNGDNKVNEYTGIVFVISSSVVIVKLLYL